MSAPTEGRCASLNRRTLSLVYEAVLVTGVLWCASFLYTVIEPRFSSTHVRVLYQIYLFFIAGTYFTWQWQHGQTLPMKTWRMRLVARSGEVVSFSQVLARYLVASLGLLFLGVGFLWALFDSEHQFLHDRIAGTRLVTE